jgi:RNA polymerase sigma factor (sigma-70 family)
MAELDDIELLREYALRNSEAAFATLVSRYINLVYSAALRQVDNHHQAEEITQAVFVILGRKARSIGSGTILAGWLFRTARLTAANYLRTEIRRAHREQEAYMRSISNENADDIWQQIAPALDDAIAGLGEKDRNAIVLKFLDGKGYKEVAAALGGTEEAAQMRVSRTLEKLRKRFAKRGVVLSASVLDGVMTTQGIQAAPSGLVASSTSAAVHGGAMSVSTLTLVKGTLKVMTWTKMKFAVGAGVVALLAFQYHQNSVQALQLAEANENLNHHSQTFAAQQSRIAELEKDTTAMLEVRHSQEQDLARLRARRTATAKAGSRDSANVPTTVLAATMQDPDASEALRDGMVSTFRKRWEPLISTLHLSPEEAEKLFQTGGNWGMNNMATLVAFTEGKMTAEAAVAAEIENKRNRTNEIRLLLGEDGFAEYQKCNESFPARELVERFDRQLVAFPITADQRVQFAGLIQAEPFETAKRLAGDFTVEALVYPDKFKERFEQLEEANRRISERASAFLTSDQLQEWELMQANNLSTQKRNILRLLRKL